MIREALTLRLLRSLDPEDAAALWVTRKSARDLSHAENEVIEEWLSIDALHRSAWARANAALRVFDGNEEDDMLVAMREHARNAGHRHVMQWRWQAAAVAVVGLFASLTLLGIDRNNGPDLASEPRSVAPGAIPATMDPLAVLGVADYTTVKGEKLKLRLADGTLAVLDTDSALDVAISGSHRTLSLLKGRIFFDVDPDASRPFAVIAGSRRIVALGTRFDVRIDNKHVRVSLLEGRLAIAQRGAKAAPTIISGGQRFEDLSGVENVTSPANMDDVSNWQRGYLTFDDTTLASAAAELNRYNGDQLTIRDPQVANYRVSGLFKAGDAGRFARTVTAIHPVKVIRVGPRTIELRAGK